MPLSGIFELIGALLVVTMLVSSFRHARTPSLDAPILPVRPYLATAFVSFIAAIVLNAALSLSTALRGNYLFPSGLNDVLIELLIAGFILPLALALSIRNLSLFMWLAFPPQRRLPPTLLSDVIGLVLQFLFVSEHAFDLSRDGLSSSALFNPDIERHAITVGFITLLIFGMAVRMLPGFSGQTRVASTRLVLATFWLGNLAALTRVLPLFAPNLLGANVALASSGMLSWLAVACLGANSFSALSLHEAKTIGCFIPAIGLKAAFQGHTSKSPSAVIVLRQRKPSE